MANAKLRHEELHEEEIPISILALQQAEMNRDRKKHPDPYELKDFFCWDPHGDKDSVDAVVGAAVMEIAKQKKLPAWALFCYKDLVTNAGKADPPKILMLESPSAVLIAPRFDIDKMKVKGCLICKEDSYGKKIIFKGYGYEVTTRVPVFDGFYSLQENYVTEILDLVQPANVRR